MNYNNILLKILFNNRGIIKNKLELILSNKYPNINNYLSHIYTDSYSIKETLVRLKLNINIKPTCPICGAPLIYYGRKDRLFSTYCSLSCKSKDPKNYNKWQNAQKQYNIKHYGVEYNWQRQDVKNKCKETFTKHYGVDNPAKVKSIHEKTLINSNLTKKQNNTFNTSLVEQQSYKLLKEKYNDVITQYQSKLYPFNCDFYIPNLDLYIECNYHWTHGKHPYDKTNDIDKYNEWLEKSQISIFYKNAIETWTIRDVKKREIAKQNNLNYIEFWNINELKEWLNKN